MAVKRSAVYCAICTHQKTGGVAYVLCMPRPNGVRPWHPTPTPRSRLPCANTTSHARCTKRTNDHSSKTTRDAAPSCSGEYAPLCSLLTCSTPCNLPNPECRPGYGETHQPCTNVISVKRTTIHARHGLDAYRRLPRYASCSRLLPIQELLSRSIDHPAPQPTSRAIGASYDTLCALFLRALRCPVCQDVLLELSNNE